MTEPAQRVQVRTATGSLLCNSHRGNAEEVLSRDNGKALLAGCPLINTQLLLYHRNHTFMLKRLEKDIDHPNLFSISHLGIIFV